MLDIYRLLADGVEELIAPSDPIACPALVMTGDEDFGNSPGDGLLDRRGNPGR